MHDTERDRIFGEWLAGHKGILFKVIHAYAFVHADRQDLFQEIAIQVWLSVDAYRGESSVPTWMYRVALNTAIGWTRKEGRHQRGKEQLEVAEGLLTTASAEKRDPRVEWLYHQIAQLKDVDRSVAWLLLDGFRLGALPIVGAAAALLSGGAIYVGHRARARREQGFGEPLRDQLNRRIAQLYDAATEARRGSVLVIGLMGDLSDGHHLSRQAGQR